MKRAVALICTLSFAVAAAGVIRRAAAQPPLPKRLHWAITLTSADGVVGSMSSTGALVVKRGGLTCSATLSEVQRLELEQMVKTAEPTRWPASRDGALLKLARETETFETSVAESSLPADLSALYSGAAGLRDTYLNVCTTGATTSWAIESFEEGGFIYRYHRVTVDSSGNVTVQPNSHSNACKHVLDAAETAQFADLVLAANPLAWATTYVRKENPSGCCDQIHSGFRLFRVSGNVSASFLTDWFSDHDALPSDLTAIDERLFGPLGTALFERYGAACGPVF